VIGQWITFNADGFLEIITKPWVLISPGNASTHANKSDLGLVGGDDIEIYKLLTICGSIPAGEIYSEGMM
jgi:hypothetical protein